MGVLWAMAWKDIRLLLRDRMACFFTLVFPVIFGIFFGVIFGGGSGGPREMAVLLVDEDGTEASAAFGADLDATVELAVRPVASRAEAQELVRKGDARAFILLPEGFGERAGMPFGGESLPIEIGIDPSRQAEAGMLRGVVTERAYAGISRVMMDTPKMQEALRRQGQALRADSSVDPVTRTMLLAFFDNVDRMLVSIPRDDPDAEGGGQARAWNPVSVTVQEVRAQRRGPKNPFEVTFAQAIVWSVMGSAAGFAIGLGEERARGTMLRLRVSPLSWAQLLGGKAMACFVATLGVAVLILVLGLLPPFRVSVGSWPMLTVALLSVAVGFVGMMMLLAVIGRASGSGQMGWAVMLVLAVIGGGMVPLFVMPGFMQTLSVISPVRWAILAIEGGIWRGYSAAEMALPAGVLLGLGVAGFAVGAWMFSRGEE